MPIRAYCAQPRTPACLQGVPAHQLPQRNQRTSPLPDPTYTQDAERSQAGHQGRATPKQAYSPVPAPPKHRDNLIPGTPESPIGMQTSPPLMPSHSAPRSPPTQGNHGNNPLTTTASSVERGAGPPNAASYTDPDRGLPAPSAATSYPPPYPAPDETRPPPPTTSLMAGILPSHTN